MNAVSYHDMDDQGGGAIIVAFFVLCILALLCWVAEGRGERAGRHEMELEAAHHAAGEFVAEPQTGQTKFEWYTFTPAR